MLYDTHFHSRHSIDGKADIEEYLIRANDIGIGLTVTEHMDLINPRGGEYDQPSIFDCTAMIADYARYRSDTFGLGIELGMADEALVKNDAIIEQYGWDYVLASMHIHGNIGCGEIDYRDTTTTEVYSAYFEQFVSVLRAHDFVDAVAHIDYICRYNPLPDKYLTFANGGDGLNELLRLMASRELAMEINTELFADQQARTAYRELLAAFCDLGGKYFTVGSDAHRATRLGFMLRDAYDLGRTAGLRPVYFMERKKRYIE